VTGLAVVAAALAVALAMPTSPSLPKPPPSARRLPPTWMVLPGLVLMLVVALDGHSLVLALIAAAAGSAAWVLVRRSRMRREADAHRVRVVEACEAIASELRAGQPPLAALDRSVEVWPDLAPVAASCRFGADVSEAFRRLSNTPGAGSLGEVASAWQVSQSVGAGLAHALDRVADSARGNLAAHRVVAAELASAQATARMVALLPVLMILLSDGSGADPWHFLLQTTPGIACLAAGLALALAGMWWIDRIVARVHSGDA
jgi:tight adherence protein B